MARLLLDYHDGLYDKHINNAGGTGRTGGGSGTRAGLVVDLDPGDAHLVWSLTIVLAATKSRESNPRAKLAPYSNLRCFKRLLFGASLAFGRWRWDSIRIPGS